MPSLSLDLIEGVPLQPAIPPFFVRWRRVLVAAYALLRDPNRLDQVFELGEAIDLPTVRKAWPSIAATSEGQRLLMRRPYIDDRSVDWEALEALPDGTLGREYVRFLKTNSISPAPFERPPTVGDDRAAYVIQRLRQTHDLWHVVTGYRTDVEGEILLQAFSLAQTRSRASLLIALFGSLRFFWGRFDHARRLLDAYRWGRKARYLGTFAWEDHWDRPLGDLRQLLALT